MESIEGKLKEHYSKNLRPEGFIEFKIRALNDENQGMYYDFWFSCLYQFFSSGKYSGVRLLDLGSGPTVHNVASASAFVPNIILSELVESNRYSLQKWLRGDSNRLDWTPFLERVARAEGLKDMNIAVSEIEKRIRSAVKAVVYCDLLEDQVIPEEYTQKPYDIILTSLTIEAAAMDLESYSKILGRINRLLTPGGKLLMIGVLSCTFWRISVHKFHYLTVEQSEVHNLLEANGFGDINWKLSYRNVEGLPYDGNKVYFLSCTKL